MQPIYVIALEDRFVAEDLAGILRDHSAESRVFLERSMEAARSRVEQLNSLAALVIDNRLEQAQELGLPDAARRKAGKVVVISGKAPRREQAEAGWSFVTHPFNAQMFLNAL